MRPALVILLIIGVPVVVVATVIYLTLYMDLKPSAPKTVAAPMGTTAQIESSVEPLIVEVQGTGPAKTLTWSEGDGGTGTSHDLENVSLPWSKEINPTGIGPASVSAMIEEGEVVCLIKKGDKVLQEKHAKGSYALVICSRTG
jgi:hypothetical protein